MLWEILWLDSGDTRVKPVGRLWPTDSSVSSSTLPSWVRKSSSSVLRSLEFAGESRGDPARW